MTGQRIKELRKQAGLSQRRLASVAGLHYRTIQGIEEGARLRVETALAIARALGVGLEDLFEEEAS